MKAIKLFLYFLRWQLAGLIIYPITLYFIENITLGVIIGNTWGCALFYFIDRWLTTKEQGKENE